VISLHLSGTPLDARFMVGATATTVAQLFVLPTYKERQLQPGLFIEEPTELKTLAEQITGVLNETGAILAKEGFPSLAHFILHRLNHAGDPHPTAEYLVESLAKAFPAFNDIHIVRGQGRSPSLSPSPTFNPSLLVPIIPTLLEVYILKKAQLLAADLNRLLGTKEKLFLFPDLHRLTAFSDNVLPAVLRELKILKVADSVRERIDQGDAIKAAEQIDTELRAAAIVASEAIIRIAHTPEFLSCGLGETNSMMLDYYLWKVGKEPQFRTIQRHSTKDTIFY